MAVMEAGATVVVAIEADWQFREGQRLFVMPLAQVTFSWDSTKVWRQWSLVTGEA